MPKLYHKTYFKDNIRRKGEIKIRGAKFQKKIVALEIKSGEGIIVYPEQEVFGGVGEER